ncbi:MAG: hypothetical protein JWR43_1800, partial [Phenylobacterium sp.]|nr:hypothetical protein [Phenylobacterium sp.]
PPTNDREAALLMPLATCLCAFLVIRGVFEQPDIHPMIFMMVAMVIALVARAKAQAAQLPEIAARQAVIEQRPRRIQAAAGAVRRGRQRP